MSTEPPILLDTDFVSSFAWVDRLDIIEGLFSRRMVILEEVMEELDRVRHLADRVCFSVMRGHMRRVDMLSDSPEAVDYVRLHDSGRYGSGEAACMAYLSHHDGALASNNLRDVKAYCAERGVPLLTTADVLVRACRDGCLGQEEAGVVWQQMLRRRCKLPATTFSEYLAGIGKMEGNAR